MVVAPAGLSTGQWCSASWGPRANEFGHATRPSRRGDGGQARPLRGLRWTTVGHSSGVPPRRDLGGGDADRREHSHGGAEAEEEDAGGDRGEREDDAGEVDDA